MMTKTDTDVLTHNRRLIERYFEEVWNKGRLEVLDEILDPDYKNHSPGRSNPIPGPAGLKPIVSSIRNAFQDLHYQIVDTVITEEKITARVRMTGVHSGDFFGIPATGKSIDVDQINIEYVCNGKIAEHWRITDMLMLMTQLGVV